MRAANKSASVLCCYIMYLADASSRVWPCCRSIWPPIYHHANRGGGFDSALIDSLTDDAAIVMDTRIYLTTWSKSCAHSSTVRSTHSAASAPIYHRVPLQVEHPSIYNAAVWSYGNAGQTKLFHFFLKIRSDLVAFLRLWSCFAYSSNWSTINMKSKFAFCKLIFK
jgi:hypothetical protein